MKPLPRVQPLGRVRLNFVKVYAPNQGVVLKAHRDNGGCELFLDLEDSDRPEGVELHLGIAGSFRPEPLRNSEVKDHIDIYIPRSEVSNLLRALTQANLRKGGT